VGTGNSTEGVFPHAPPLDAESVEELAALLDGELPPLEPPREEEPVPPEEDEDPDDTADSLSFRQPAKENAIDATSRPDTVIRAERMGQPYATPPARHKVRAAEGKPLSPTYGMLHPAGVEASPYTQKGGCPAGWRPPGTCRRVAIPRGRGLPAMQNGGYPAG
jgi:hypothetical protein